LFAFVFSLGCVFLCSHLSCTFDGWVPIVDFFWQDFSSYSLPTHPHAPTFITGMRGNEQKARKKARPKNQKSETRINIATGGG
jgi:hypothetical protein